jgi:hypothetical protein
MDGALMIGGALRSPRQLFATGHLAAMPLSALRKKKLWSSWYGCIPLLLTMPSSRDSQSARMLSSARSARLFWEPSQRGAELAMPRPWLPALPEELCVSSRLVATLLLSSELLPRLGVRVSDLCPPSVIYQSPVSKSLAMVNLLLRIMQKHP